MCTALISNARKRLTESLSMRVCAEFWQAAKAVAAVQAAVLVASLITALALLAVTQTPAQQLAVGAVSIALSLFCIIKILNYIKKDPAFMSRFERAAEIDAQTLRWLATSDDGIKVVVTLLLSISLDVRTLTAHCLKAASARCTSADRARASILMRICTATTHTSSSLRRPATA